MSRRSTTYHLAFADERKETITGHVHLRCRACGDEFSFCLPCSIPMFAGVTKPFEREHARCRPEWERERAGLVEALVQRAIALSWSTEQETR